MPVQPGRARAVLVQHHARARLALALTPMRSAPLRTLDQAGRVQLRLHPRVAPPEAMPRLQVLVEMLHVPVQVVGPILIEHPLDLIDRHPLRRGLAQPLVVQPFQPILLVASPVPPELPFRHPQNLACFQCRQFLSLPSAQNIPKLLHPAVL